MKYNKVKHVTETIIKKIVATLKFSNEYNNNQKKFHQLFTKNPISFHTSKKKNEKKERFLTFIIRFSKYAICQSERVSRGRGWQGISLDHVKFRTCRFVCGSVDHLIFRMS